jgi:hypothetical protein
MDKLRITGDPPANLDDAMLRSKLNEHGFTNIEVERWPEAPYGGGSGGTGSSGVAAASFTVSTDHDVDECETWVRNELGFSNYEVEVIETI